MEGCWYFIHLFTASSLWALHLRASLSLLHWKRGEFSAMCCGRQGLTLPVVFPRDGAKGEEKEGCINKEESFWKLFTISGKRPCLYLDLLVLNLGLLLLSCLVFICWSNTLKALSCTDSAEVKQIVCIFAIKGAWGRVRQMVNWLLGSRAWTFSIMSPS